MRGTTSVILQHHRILRLPRKMTVMTRPRHTWNAIYNARNNKCHCPNSPNTAPATQNDSPTFQRNCWKTAETSFPMRGRSDQDPSRKPSAATRLATEVTFHAHHKHFVLKNTTFRVPAIIPNFTEYCACHEKWHFNFTKYCACHAKWLSWSIRDTHETLFTMRGTTGGILQHHQILRLPRKMTLQHFKEISRKQMKSLRRKFLLDGLLQWSPNLWSHHGLLGGSITEVLSWHVKLVCLCFNNPFWKLCRDSLSWINLFREESTGQASGPRRPENFDWIFICLFFFLFPLIWDFEVTIFLAPALRWRSLETLELAQAEVSVQASVEKSTGAHDDVSECFSHD